MGPRRALWVLLALLGTLTGVTPQPTRSLTPSPTPSPTTAQTTVLTTPGFEMDKFQGEWFVLGLAGSTHSKADRHLLSPFTATFEQNKRQQLKVSYAMIRGDRCITWSYWLLPTAQPRRFSVYNNRELGPDTEEMWVHDTDYSTFALMSSRRKSVDQSIIRVHLLFRLWAIQTEMLSKFLCLLKAKGLTEANIVFPDLPDWRPYRRIC